VAKSTGAVHVAIELMDRGSLGDLKKLLLPKKIEIPEAILAAMARDICMGLCHLHMKKKILHRDIKPENVLINSKGQVRGSNRISDRDIICNFEYCVA
jgi:serine/threonine protein kinase